MSKCFYYLLTWKFNENGDPIPMSITEQQEHTTNIQITDENNNNSTIITQLEVSIPHKTLGTWKTISGCEKRHIKYLSEKSNNFARRIANARVSHQQARTAFNSIYIPSMIYSLPASNIPCKELQIIQRRTTEKFIAAMGFDRHIPRAIAYGPQNYGGLNLPHLYTEECVLKIESLICHVRADTSIGKMMVYNINWIQMLAGISQPILHSKTPLLYIDNNWFMHIRDFLNTINGHIHIPTTWMP